MSAQSSFEQVGDFTVSRYNGVVQIGTTEQFEVDNYSTPQFRHVLRAVLADAACTSLVIDLNDAAHFDSTALGALVEARQESNDKDVTLAVDVTDNHRIFRLLQVTGLDSVFHVIDTYQEEPSS